jgi:hypothetical protein
VAVDLSTAPDFRPGRARVLFEGEYLSRGGADYDVSANGQRFVMVRRASGGATTKTLTIRLNWLEELKRFVPIK